MEDILKIAKLIGYVNIHANKHFRYVFNKDMEHVCVSAKSRTSINGIKYLYVVMNIYYIYCHQESVAVILNEVNTDEMPVLDNLYAKLNDLVTHKSIIKFKYTEITQEQIDLLNNSERYIVYFDDFILEYGIASFY